MNNSNAANWLFMKDGLDDFRDGLPPAVQGSDFLKVRFLTLQELFSTWGPGCLGRPKFIEHVQVYKARVRGHPY